MPGTCNDCGAPFKGDVKDHFDEAHPGSPRFRWRDVDGVSYLACPEGDLKVVEGGKKHLQTTAHVSGKSSDPADYFALHLMSHEQGD